MNKRNIIFYSFIISIVSSFFLINYIKVKVNPIIYNYSTVEAKRFTTILLNNSIKKEILSNIDNNLFIIKKDNKGNIQTLDYNTKKVNDLLEKITENIQKSLLELENGNIKNLDISDTFKGKNYPKSKYGIICELPMSSVFSNSLLSNIGPNIPIKLSFIGSVITNLNTKIKSYGINNLYLETSIHIETEERITMPLMTKEVKTKMEIPLSIKIIEGQIPDYYIENGLHKESNAVLLPIE